MSDLDDLGSLDDQGSLDDLGDLDAPSAPAPAAPQPASGLGAVMQDLLAKRNFGQVIQIAENQKEAVARDPQAQALVEQAQAGLETDAYIKSFLDGSRKAYHAGQRDKAKEFFDKARSLEPSHPAVLEFANELRAHSAAAAAPAPPTPEPAAQVPAPSPAETQPLSRASVLPGPAPEGPVAVNPAPTPVAPEPPVVAAPSPAAPTPVAPEPPVAAAPAPVAPEPPVASPVAPSAPEPPAAAEPEMLSFDEPEPLDLGSPAEEPNLDAIPPAEPLDIGPEDLDAEIGDELALDSLDLESLDGDLDSAAAGEDLAALGVVDTDAPDDEQHVKIQELLAEGQQHYEADRLQDAIDVWSRIFLLDIDNAAASDRIDKARERKAEKERQAEEIFHQATSEIESRDLEGAKDSLRKVLELQPNHPTAEDYLEQLEAGQVPAIKRQAEVDSDIDLLDDGGLGDLEELGTTDRDMDAAVARDRVVVTKKADRKMIMLAGGVGVAVVALLFLLVTQWDSLFPNADDDEPAGAQVSMQLERAKKMHEAGNVEAAIPLLEGLSVDDAGYAEAQVLLAQWRAEVAPPEIEAPTGPSQQDLARRQAFLDAALQARDVGELIRASVYLTQARKIQDFDAEEQQLAGAISKNLEPIQPLIDQFSNGQYVDIIPQLWRLHDEQPGSADIRRLLLDSYYNLALDDLQKGLAADAASKLRDVQEVGTESPEMKRLREFAETYAGRGEDLLYRIFVKYQPRRKYD
ncbi:MAG: hypothetical protein MPN21_10080 [Thermoanaerobaculia bacterium]|nr:hypothetical protein [Thermoanaerobaculia bacterium]